MIDTIKQSNAEMDPEKRILLLQNIMAEYHELAPAIWLTNAVYTTAYSDRVVSFDYRPTGTVFETLIMKDD
jgi:ABC-type transport system substrate-binding protein